MLTQSGINAVYGIAEELAARGIRLFPIEGTPLSELVSCSVKCAQTAEAANAGSDVSVPDMTALLIEGSTAADGVGHNTHDQFMAAAVETIGKAINFNTQLAKNVVNPMISRVAEALSASLEKFSADASVPVSIHPVFDRSFWSMPYSVELFSRYTDTVPDNVVYSAPPIPYDPALLETKIEAFDAAIREYVGEVDTDESAQKVEHIWNSTFGAGQFNTKDVLSGGRETIDRAIVVYLGAQFLGNNPPAGTEMSTLAWETMCNNVKAQAGRVVNFGLSKLERDRRMGRMVIEFPQTHAVGQRIYVDGPSYNQYLQSGGTPETVLGSFFSERVTNSQSLLEKREGFNSIWKTTQSTLVSQSVSERLSTLIGALDQAVTVLINEIPEADLVVTREDLHTRLRERLRRISSSDLQDLYRVARDTICYVIYPHTDVLSTLEAIDEQMRMSPNLNVREAALYAMIDQLAKWLAKLIDVESVRI